MMFRKISAFYITCFFGNIFIATVAGDSQNSGRGFGDHFSWHNLEEGLIDAKESNKPLMLIIHKSWCGACKALKPQFAASSEIKDLGKNFVMVNVEDDEEPNDAQYAPDGGYIPRILFLNPEGRVMKDFYNEHGNPSYKYYYSDANSVSTTMRKVLKSLKSTGRTAEEL